jgi:hypothetical protein
LVAGRRFGKTYLALTELLNACANDNQTAWYVAPTYRQAKQIAWKELKRMTPASVIASSNESDLSLELINGSTAALRGADNYDSLRGVGLDFLVMDEFADMHPDAWAEVLRPMLADRQGHALWIGTPKGYNHFYDLYRYAESTDGWEAWQFTTADGLRVSSDEIEVAMRDMGEREFKQEFLATFEALAGRVYSNFDNAESVADVSDIGGSLLVGMDFNVDPMTAVISVRVADQLHVIDEILMKDSNTELMTEELKERYPRRPITVYPDPSGRARKTSAPVGRTDFAILGNAGFEVRAPRNAHPVIDRINTVQAALKTADNKRRLFIHPRCKNVIRSLDGLTYIDGSHQPDKSSGLDHIADAIGYLVMGELPLRRNIEPRRPQRWS